MKTIHLLTLGVLIALLCGATGCAVTHKFVSTTTAIEKDDATMVITSEVTETYEAIQHVKNNNY